MTTTSTRDRQKGRLISRRLRAILAGGLVLGVGAAITLAVWNDSEFAKGTFTAGHFNMEGTADNSTWAEHATSGGAATLTFSTGFDNLAPDEAVAAPFAVRLDADTTYDATVSLQDATPNPTGVTGLTYSIATVAAWADCDATPTSPTWLIEDAALDSVSGATTFSLTQGSSGNPGTQVNLCLVVTADSALVQDSSVVETWQFQAVQQ